MLVAVAMSVLVGGTPVLIAVAVGVLVGGTAVLVAVAVGAGVLVGGTAVLVAVAVGVLVDGTAVLVAVAVGVGVGGPVVAGLGEWGMKWARGQMSDEELDVELLMHDFEFLHQLAGFRIHHPEGQLHMVTRMKYARA